MATVQLGDSYVSLDKNFDRCMYVWTMYLCSLVFTGVTYQHHVEQLAPSVKRLAELERQVQTNFLRNQHLIA